MKSGVSQTILLDISLARQAMHACPKDYSTFYTISHKQQSNLLVIVKPYALHQTHDHYQSCILYFAGYR
jgi:hypothetical protein